MKLTRGAFRSSAVLSWLSSFLLAFFLSASPGLGEDAFDVVIYGGTSSGVAAAVQATRMGKSVVIVEPTQFLGGMTSHGLGWTDTGDKRVIGGISREFYQRVKRHYDTASAWPWQDRDSYTRYRPKDDAMWTFEPKVANAIFEGFVAEHSIRVDRGERLDRPDGVKLDGKRLAKITMESGKTYAGRMFIDASYEGDLLAASGVSYTIGRESNAKYDENLNGVQKEQNTHNHRFVKPVDPYLRAGDPRSGLLPGIQSGPPGEEGQGDKRIQAYCYRMCLSNVPKNRVPFPKPEHYDEREYELLLRVFESGDLRVPMSNGVLPNGKTDTNNNHAFSTDNIGRNYTYPEAGYAERERILKQHVRYQKGLMWTLANHPRVPESVRQQVNQWGLAKDEFVDNGNWPRQIYVREARRMLSDYVMTEHDCRRTRKVADSVGLGSYNMDSHNVQRYVTPSGGVQNEGDVQLSPGGPYLIGYRSIVPQRGELENLLAPVCMSASHIAYGSIRMEPVFMVLGQSAATAAVLAIDDKLAVQEVPYAKLRDRLLKDRQVLDLPEPIPPRRLIVKAKLPGLVLDDQQAKYQGVWTTSSSSALYVEQGYRHDGNQRQGEKSATFRTRLRGGEYEVRFSYAAHGNRASNARVTIQHANGKAERLVNQRRKPTIDGLFVSLGSYQFDDGKDAVVMISNQAADGYVIVDAVQFLAKP